MVLVGCSILAQTNETNTTPAKESKNPKYARTHFVSMIGPNVLIGMNRFGFGINYTGFQFDPKKKVFTGVSFGYEQLATPIRLQNELGRRSSRSGQFGIQVFPRISKHFFVKLGLLFQAGREHYKYVTPTWGFNKYGLEMVDKTWVVGIAPSQGITFIPTTSAGVSLTLSFYQRFTNSEYYRYDIGGMLSLAIRF